MRVSRHAAPSEPRPAVVLLTRGRSRATGLGAAWAKRLWEARRSATPQQRRARTLLGSATLFALVVVATSFPLSGLLSQRGQLASDAGQLSTVREQNAALTRQASQLHGAGAVDGLARHDYGLVGPGQKAYAILPSSGAPSPVTAGSGHVPLDGPPVAPGSARSQRLLGIPPSAAPNGHARHGTASTNARLGGNGSNGPQAPPPGFWTRVVRTLEFWH